MISRRQELGQLDYDSKARYQGGSLLLAVAYLTNGLVGLTSTLEAKYDLHRCYYIVIETILGGQNLKPSIQELEDNQSFFLFIFHLHKIVMIALCFMIVQGTHLKLGAQLGAILTLWDMIFFTNPFYQATEMDTTTMTKLWLKQIAFIGVSLLLATHGKTTTVGSHIRSGG